MTERLRHIEEELLETVEGHLPHLDLIDAKEMGEVIDMIKDIEEAIYYCTVTKAMHEGKEWEPKKEQIK